MTFGPIKTPIRARRFSTYDLEWDPFTLDVRIACRYDGNQGYSYSTVERFIAGTLTSENRGMWFFAHGGGKYDFQFLMYALVKAGYSMKAKFSGASAIIIAVCQGKNVWHFIDSYWLMRDSLASIGKSVDMHKTGPTDDMDEPARKRWYADAPINVLREYCLLDCRILYEAIREAEYELWSMGSQLQPTIASTAMQLFRRKYLKREVVTHAPVNIRAKDAYFGSRVEVIVEECGRAAYYDINSSFPFAMCETLPGSLLRMRDSLDQSALERLVTSRLPFLADVTWSIPDCAFPPAPLRHGKSVYFPVGTSRSYLTHVDIALIMEAGGTVQPSGVAFDFEPFHDMMEYAVDIFELRRGSTGFRRLFLKYVLNTLYGKFGESEEKTLAHVNPNRETRERLLAIAREAGELEQRALAGEDVEILKQARMAMPGVWIESKVDDVPHQHYPIAASITAHARANLWRFMRTAWPCHYCDTDGFSSEKFDMPTGDGLGKLKLEKLIKRGVFLAPKVYRLDTDDKVIVHAKGFSLGRGDEAIERFDKLARGEILRADAMLSMRDLWAKKSWRPQRAKASDGGDPKKQLKGTQRTKRRHLGDGSTVPWDVREITG